MSRVKFLIKYSEVPLFFTLFFFFFSFFFFLFSFFFFLFVIRYFLNSFIGSQQVNVGERAVCSAWVPLMSTPGTYINPMLPENLRTLALCFVFISRDHLFF